MPGRPIPLITSEIYHVYNRGIDRRPTFTTKRELGRALSSIRFYRFFKPPVKLSKLLRSNKNRQNEILKILTNSKKLVDIISYCFMPNHFHFLLRQQMNEGISKFLSNFQNSYTRYFNTRHDRDGSLFLNQFKAVRIENDEQLVHVSRYIHLNPYTSYVVKTLEALEKFPWSSLQEYLNSEDGITDKSSVLGFFKDKHDYKKFVFNQANYQRTLKEIIHIMFDQ